VAKAPKVLVLNGPNLNLLGTREPEIYGTATLADIEALCHKQAKALGLTVDCRQSNTEGELVGWIQEARGGIAGIIMNPGAYTHTSVAILDALLAVGLPVIEVHLSNTHKREDFRQNSYVSRAAEGVICGFGVHGYLMALDAMAALLTDRRGK
jgi:3-dehydroquinate dehydratase-2